MSKQKTVDEFEQWLEQMAASHKAIAESGVWDGRQTTEYYVDCRKQHQKQGVTIVYTRRAERLESFTEYSLSLSVSSFDPMNLMPQAHRKQLAGRIVAKLFWPFAKRVWVQPPLRRGVARDIWHYLLFCDERWKPLDADDIQLQQRADELREKGMVPFLEHLRRQL